MKKAQRISIKTLRNLSKYSNTPNISDEGLYKEAKKKGLIVTGYKPVKISMKKSVKKNWVDKLFPF